MAWWLWHCNKDQTGKLHVNADIYLLLSLLDRKECSAEDLMVREAAFTTNKSQNSQQAADQSCCSIALGVLSSWQGRVADTRTANRSTAMQRGSCRPCDSNSPLLLRSLHLQGLAYTQQACHPTADKTHPTAQSMRQRPTTSAEQPVML